MGIIFGKIGVETPKHRVLKRTPHYEVREYPTQIAASTFSTDFAQHFDDSNTFMGEAFMLLATYSGIWRKGFNIKKDQPTSGKPAESKLDLESQRAAFANSSDTNEAEAEQIAMTAPVLEESDGNRYKLTFLLPAKYTMDTVPLPRDQRVHIESMPVRVVAVKTMRGSWTPEQMEPLAQELIEQLRFDNIKVKEPREWETAYYNPPMTIPCLRTNEVMVHLAPGQTFY